jgi:hypothetical protein
LVSGAFPKRAGHSLYLLFVLACGLLVAPPAQAAFPGQNGKIAFVRASQVWTVNPNGTGEVQITSSASASTQPEWSPDGTKIVFSTGANIYLVNPNGTGQTQVTTAGGDDPDWQPVPGPLAPGYPRPKSASPIRVSLVPAYRQCAPASANRTHGPPLAFLSCNPPIQESGFLTLGTPDVNGAAANSVGFLRLTAILDAPGSPDETDIGMSFSLTDVRCGPAEHASFCTQTNAQPGADYSGHLKGLLSLRITDRYNLPSPAGRDPGTAVDATLRFDPSCGSTAADQTIGSTCSSQTTANALLPGVARAGRRAVWEIGDVRIFDGGADGGIDASSTDNTLFLRQGVFIP